MKIKKTIFGLTRNLEKTAPVGWISHHLFSLKSYFCYVMSMSCTLNIVFHAKFRFDNSNNFTTETQFRQLFLAWVNQNYGIPYTEHQLMIEKYMEKLAEELRVINNNKFDKSYYMAWIWDGLKQYWRSTFRPATGCWSKI